MNSDKQKSLIIFVDHDTEAINDIISKIREIKRIDTLTKLEDRFCFEKIVIEPKNVNPKDINDEIIKFQKTPDLVLVDLCFGDHKHNGTGVHQGREIASNLAQRYPFLKVGVYTRFGCSNYERSLISTDQFVLFLEKLSDMLEGPSKTGANDWSQLLEKATKSNHHIVSVSENPRKALRISNGQTLCWGCHSNVHWPERECSGG